LAARNLDETDPRISSDRTADEARIEAFGWKLCDGISPVSSPLQNLCQSNLPVLDLYFAKIIFISGSGRMTPPAFRQSLTLKKETTPSSRGSSLVNAPRSFEASFCMRILSLRRRVMATCSSHLDA